MESVSKRRGKKGLGSVYQITQNGQPAWRAAKSITVLNPDTGKIKRVRITGTGPTQTIARERLEKHLERRKDSLAASEKSAKAGKTLYKDWFYQWHEKISPERVSDVVRLKYRRFGEMYLLPYIGDTYVEDLDSEDLRQLVDFTWPSITKPDGTPVLSQSARINVYKVLQMTLREAVRTKKINIVQNPLDGVRPPVRERKILSLGDKIGKTQGLIKWMVVNEHPDYCRMLFQWLGLRRSERLGLQWSAIKNLNGKEPKLVISHQLARKADGSGYYLKKPKTQSSIRTIPLEEPFLSALRDWKDTQDDYKKSPKWKTQEQFADLVFLTPTGGLITQNQDNDDWKKILQDYTGEDDPQWRGHLNRHICATLLAQHGVKESVAKKILGHASEAMTSYYTSVTTESLREPLQSYGAVLTKRVPSEKRS